MHAARRKALGEILKGTHELWDLEAFGREVKRRKVLEQLYTKLYLHRQVEGAELVFGPRDVLNFIYSRAADGYPFV